MLSWTSFCCMPWGVNQIRLLICIIALLHLFSPLFCYSLFKFHLILKSCFRTIFQFLMSIVQLFNNLRLHCLLEAFFTKPSRNLNQSDESRVLNYKRAYLLSRLFLHRLCTSFSRLFVDAPLPPSLCV